MVLIILHQDTNSNMIGNKTNFIYKKQINTFNY